MVKLTISEIGARGDGIANHDGAQVFVPFALPGDQVEADLIAGGKGKPARAQVRQHEKSDRSHQTPPCPHFKVCGGCVAQHMNPEIYKHWKQERIEHALSQRGIDPGVVEPIHLVSPGSRRRAALSFSVTRKRNALGFRKMRGHEIVDLKACPLLSSDLFDLAMAVKAELPNLLPKGGEGQLKIQMTDSGADLLIDTKAELDLGVREALGSLSFAQDLARITFGDELVAEQRRPSRDFGGYPVDLPPWAFMQPTEAGEAFLIREILGAIKTLEPAKPLVADLFSGSGTFSVPVSKVARVHAYDDDAIAARALDQSSSRASAALTCYIRDLFDSPLMETELDQYDLVIFDPPKAGARDQCERLADADVGSVVGISCNPGTFARDARVLIDGGYKLAWVKPLDQFVWSSEVEVIALFER